MHAGTMRPILARLILLGVMLLCTSCSDYDRRWKSMQSAATTTDLYAGSYEGTWESSRYKGASGKLWCILTLQGPNLYSAEFRATWHGIFSSRHKVQLHVTSRRGKGSKAVATFAGAMEIKMWIGSGRYRCDGEVTPRSLVANYDAEIDRGKFSLVRVLPTAAKPQ